MELLKNKIYRMKIIDYTADGTGVARVDGRVVFVPKSAVGDQCDVRITKVTKNIIFGKIEKIITASPQRIKPQCSAAKWCGGCCYQHITYEEELRAKEKKVRDALTRIGGQEESILSGITAAPSTTHYRNKAQYPVGLNAEGDVITGFYRPRSHDIVPVKSCLIQSEKADKIAALVRDWMEENQVQPYNQQTKKGSIRHIYIRCGEKSGECQLTLISAAKKLTETEKLIAKLREEEPSLTGVLLNINRREDNVVLGKTTEVLWGNAQMKDWLCGNQFMISPEAFYQVNHAQAEKLYQKALEYAALTGEETVLDLYCGAGTITLALAGNAKKVIGVEIVEKAVENAKENAKRNNIANAEFYCADAGEAAKRFVRAKEQIDVLVVDPPRKGLDEAARDAVLQIGPEKIVYVSCDPATLARDVKELTGAGYQMQKAEAFDLFPRTFHVECVCLLTRTEK